MKKHGPQVFWFISLPLLLVGCNSPEYDSELRYCGRDQFAGFSVKLLRHDSRSDTLFGEYLADRIPHNLQAVEWYAIGEQRSRASRPYWAKGAWRGRLRLEQVSNWEATHVETLAWRVDDWSAPKLRIAIRRSPSLLVIVNDEPVTVIPAAGNPIEVRY